jgi:Xaa-Pro aminopeptidase
MFDLPAVQAALNEFQFDAWLLCDFRGSNLLARRVLDLADRPLMTRRFFYLVPVRGQPHKLVHRIETGALDHLPGAKTIYLRWQELESGLVAMLKGHKRVAMEYSPRNANPYVSRVDAGLFELVRSAGADVGSSGDLIQLFEAAWDDEQWRMHQAAAVHTDSAYARVWQFVAARVRAGQTITERQVQDEILRHFAEHGLFADHPPIVAVGPHSGDPHYETGDAPLHEGEFLLVDLWAKLDKPRAVYSDLTRVGFIGKSVPRPYAEIFTIVAGARDAAIARVRTAFAQGETLQGWQVDEAAREFITKAGYGQAFVHRTGHSIGQETHGNGANMDNLETHEERRVLRRTCFSIEPGIYLPEFGVRSEVNVFIDGQGQVHVTGGALQREVVPILANRES